jgi:hypothetical protein
MAEEIGIQFDAVQQMAQIIDQAVSALEAVQGLCDGACATLTSVTAIPGTGAVIGPVIATFTSMRPALVKVIDEGRAASQFMNEAIQTLGETDSALADAFAQANDAAGSLEQMSVE